MTKNTLTDLNNHLFAEMERLDDDSLTGEELKQELSRAKGMASIATQIVMNARTVLDAAKFNDERMDMDNPAPKILIGE